MSERYKPTEVIFLKVIAEQDIICYQSIRNVLKNLQRKLMLGEILSTSHIDNPHIRKMAGAYFEECSCEITDFDYKQVLCIT